MTNRVVRVEPEEEPGGMLVGLAWAAPASLLLWALVAWAWPVVAGVLSRLSAFGELVWLLLVSGLVLGAAYEGTEGRRLLRPRGTRR